MVFDWRMLLLALAGPVTQADLDLSIQMPRLQACCTILWLRKHTHTHAKKTLFYSLHTSECIQVNLLSIAQVENQTADF